LIVVLGSVSLLFSARARAHVEVESGPAPSNATSEVVFAVGHGCDGKDTFKVVIDIPASVTSVRPMRSDFANPTVQKDQAGTITSVTWQKPVAEALDTDILFYRLSVRLKTPDQLLTTVYFTVHQTCRAADGTLSTVDWVDIPPSTATGNPAAALKLVPARMPGWNKFTVPTAMTDLSVFFKDALIVWKGTSSAYSANPHIASLITSTSGVTALTSLNAGDEVWVKY
jgi:hypothetical protein